MSALPAEVGRIVYTIFPDTSARKKYELAEQWSEIVTRIKDPKVAPEKSALRLISLGVYGDQRSDKAALRHASNLLAITGVEGDYDGKVVPLEDAAERIGLAGIKAVFYTTPSHAPDAPKWRILAPLSREYPPSERARFLARINGILGGILADESFTLSQSFYIGRVEGREYEVIDLDGDCIDQRDEFDATAIMPKGKSTADGGRTDETTDAEHRANILTGKQFHQSLRALSSRLIGRGMPPTDVEAVLVGLMQESTERGTERWRERLAEIPRLVESAAAKFRDPRREGEAPDPPDDDRWAPPEGTEDVGADRADIPLHWIGDLKLQRAGTYIIKGVLGSGALSVVYGDSNTGKTFFALDLACHVAQGIPWRGRRTRGGLVVYVAGEGFRSVEHRAIAYRDHKLQGGEIPLAIYPDAVNLLEQGADTVHLIRLIREAEASRQLPLALLIVDTLARAMPGGDESSGEDMGAVVRHADLIRGETGAHLCFIHHCGKDAARGARGHSSLRAACDTEIEVSGTEGTRTAKVTKQRDHASGDAFGFDLEAVTLGEDEDGDEIRTCIVRDVDAPAPRRREPSGRNQQLMLGAVRQYVAEHGDLIATPAWHDLCRAQGMAKSRWSETRVALVQAGWIVESVGGLRYVP